jgi:ERCC4-type nuclease
MSITVDTREYSQQKDKLVKYLVDKSIKVYVEYLYAGDYYISGSNRSFIVERSSIFDMLNKVKSGRLWDQLRKIREAKDAEPLFMLEGSPNMAVKRGKWNPMSVTSILNSISLDWGIKVIYSPSIIWSAINLASLTRFTCQDAKIHKLRYDKKPDDINMAIKFVVEGIPFVGPVFSESLLKEFKSIKNLANADVDALIKIPGIGENKGKFIHKVLTSDYVTAQK